MSSFSENESFAINHASGAAASTSNMSSSNPTGSRRRRVKMSSDLRGMMSLGPTSEHSPAILPSLSNQCSDMMDRDRSILLMDDAPLLPLLSTTSTKSFRVDHEEIPLLSPARRLRRLKRRLLLDSVVNSTMDQMAALQLQQSQSSSSLRERFDSISSVQDYDDA